MATIPSTNYSSADVILEAAGSVRAFNSNDTDVRTLAGVLTGGYSSADWAGKSNAASLLLFTPAYHVHTGYAPAVYMTLYADGSMEYDDNESGYYGSWLTRQMVLNQPYVLTIKNASGTPSNLNVNIGGMGSGNIQTTLGRTQAITRTLYPTSLLANIAMDSTDTVDNNIRIELTLDGVTKSFEFISP